MINVREKSTTSRENRSMSFPKRILVDIVVLSVFVIVFVEFYNPNNSPLPLQISQQPKRILLDQEIELNWERQHVDDLQQTLRGVSESQAALVQLNVRMERKLKEMELKLAYEENALLEAQTRALRQRSAAAAAPDATEKTVSSNDAPNTSNLRRKGTLQVGDVVQIRGASTAAPWKIEKRLPDGTYEIVRATDGQKSTSVRGDVLSHYVPYQTGMEAACNVGSFDRVELVPCIVLEYFPRTRRGPLMLQGDYKVRIPGTEEYPFDEQRTFPVWKVMRKRHAVSSS
mmetsp:Transcript_16752/g.34869  ORF Transcript_16752/g.34869 Transcript_16752/m.34869 type:complete len:286 (-) Transcript_16752:180-1037(-)